MVDFETVKTLGTAIASIKTITDIAGTITNAQLRQELNGKIADLQTAILTARQKMLEMQEQYEQVLQENKHLKAQLAEVVEAEPCPHCHRKGWNVESSQPDPCSETLGDLAAFTNVSSADSLRAR